MLIDCPGNTLDVPDETLSCQSAINACRTNPEGPGPRARLYARPAGTTTWTPAGTTCLPDHYATPTTTGYRPGQTRSLTMLGRAVELRLKTPGHVYHHGDGTSQGPTASTGGPYPTGDITHTYTHPGTLTPTATTTITADYRIDHGPWQPLPGSSTQTTT
ncbi:MAG: hypothetical protein LCH98_09390 [Actinobacteria bacterium]|nr:hypothetical protein [Actinomycetota bacterium]